MALGDELKSMIMAAAASKKAVEADAKLALQKQSETESREAIEALLHIFSDDAVKKIITAHLGKGGSGRATISIKGSKVFLVKTSSAGAHVPGEQLPFTFAAQGIVASRKFSDSTITMRLDELATQNVAVSYRYAKQPDLLLITFDYSNLD